MSAALTKRDKVLFGITLVLYAFIITIYVGNALGKFHDGKPWAIHALGAGMWTVIAIFNTLSFLRKLKFSSQS